MLRAGTKGPNPTILIGLSEGNITRLKNGQPIMAPLKDFSPGMEGNLFIVYGKTEDDLEQMVKNAGLVGEETAQSYSPRLEQEEAARKEHKHILICTVGLPKSGTSTWSRSQAWPIVNPDAIRLAIHGQRFQSLAEPFVWATAKAMVRALFLVGHQTVILDATNTTNKRRDEWIDKDWVTFFKHIDTPLEVCLERAKDDIDILSVIQRMHDQFEPLDKTCLRW